MGAREAGTTLIDVAITAALAALIALAVGGAIKAAVESQTRQLERMRLQREAVAAAQRLGRVLRVAGMGLGAGQAAFLQARPDALEVSYVDPSQGVQTDLLEELRPDGTLWETLSVNGQPTVQRRLTGQDMTATRLRVLGPIFTYFDAGNADLAASLSDPDPVVAAAARRAVRRVGVALRLDGDGDLVADVTYTTSAGVWNSP